MQFGLLFMMYAPAPSDDETLYRDVLDQVAEADRLGYDIAWLAEHHFEPRLLAPVAAPARVAEEVA